MEQEKISRSSSSNKNPKKAQGTEESKKKTKTAKWKKVSKLNDEDGGDCCVH